MLSEEMEWKRYAVEENRANRCISLLLGVRLRGMYPGLQESSARYTTFLCRRWIKPPLIALERLEAAGIGFGG